MMKSVMIELHTFTFFEVVMPSPKDTHGPIVKTGPIAGENRSRNEDGQW